MKPALAVAVAVVVVVVVSILARVVRVKGGIERRRAQVPMLSVHQVAQSNCCFFVGENENETMSMMHKHV